MEDDTIFNVTVHEGKRSKACLVRATNTTDKYDKGDLLLKIDYTLFNSGQYDVKQAKVAKVVEVAKQSKEIERYKVLETKKTRNHFMFVLGEPVACV